MSAALVGSWDVEVSTPVGKLRVLMVFAETSAGLSGVASGRGEDVNLLDIRSTPGAEGDSVTWTQAITKPLRLNLSFAVTVQAGEMVGVSRAGRLPSSRVVGVRRADPADERSSYGR